MLVSEDPPPSCRGNRPPRKQLWLAALLALIFGPAGMLYATDLGAGLMWILHPLLAICTGGHSFWFSLGICVIWNVWASWQHNRRERYV